MAGAIRITELDLAPDIIHISTDYQISTDALFVDIVAESIDDHENLNDIILNVSLDPDIKYYARARVRLSTGYTSWGNVDIFTPDDTNSISLDLDLPSIVGIPLITLDDSNENFPLSLFRINVSGFTVNSTAKHASTTYFIETIDGKLIWSSPYNEFHKDSLLVNNIILKKDTVYRIKAMFHTSTDDVSQVSTVTVKTMSNDNVMLTEDLVRLDPALAKTLHIVKIPHMTKSVLKIYAVGNNTSELIYTYTTQLDPTELVIPANTLTKNANYLLTVSVDVSVDIIFKLITTY